MSPSDLITVNSSRLVDRIKALGEVGALEGGGVSRLALTPADKAGRDRVASWMSELGMSVQVDRVGNMVGVRPGLTDSPPVMTGSHIDTVRTGGLYDGNLGVLAGLEVVERLNELGIETRRPIAVGVFTNEEGARFSPDMMGSLVYVGGMEAEEALNTVGIDGKSVGDCLDEIGYGGSAPVGRPEVHAFLELHIEQGPVLDQEAIEIGVVEQVQGISWTEYTFTGVSNHAGTTPMRLRKDAGYGAMALGQFVRELANRYGGNQVATVGSMELKPNLVNVVPNYARLTVDLRNTDESILQSAEREVAAFVTALAEKEGLELSSKTLARFEPVPFAPELVDRVAHYAGRFSYTSLRMPSGAGHDAQMLARVCPAAMIFVPSKNGISHNVTEYTAPEELTRGANLLLNLMVELATDEGEIQ